MEDVAILTRLERVIAERKASATSKRSYVASLIEKGVPAISEKILEEAGEVVEAAAESGQRAHEHLVHESADLLFHLLVLLSAREVPWREIEAELARRFGTSGIDEKASRPSS